MHKARENNDGSFSIGKTWMLDDLSSIQSYNALVPSTPLEQQHKQWAANVGFIVTVGKPYYWHARTSKEKDFFIGSLVKIYRKYTGGKVPTLIGFDERERQLLAGASAAGPPAPKGPPPGPPRPEVTLPPPRPPSSQGSRPQSPYSSRAPSRDGPRRPPPPPSEEHALRGQRSRDQMGRPSTGQSGKSGTPPFSPPQHAPPMPPDQREQPPPRAAERLAADSRVPKVPIISPPEPRNRDYPSSLQAAPVAGQRERSNGNFEDARSGSPLPDSRPPSSRDGRRGPESRPTLRTQDLHPSRSTDGLRPTTPGSVSGENLTFMHSPGSSVGPRSPLREAAEKPIGSPARAERQEPEPPSNPINTPAVEVPAALTPGSSEFSKPPPAVESAEAPVPTAPTLPVLTKDPEPIQPIAETAAAAVPPPPSDLEATEPVEENDPDAHRPGLGPMIKKKQTKDVASAFRKAATAHGAFKPRPGGAGERLLAAAKKQKAAADEPDGITSVVPAPFLLRTNSENTVTSPATPEAETPPVVSSSPEKEVQPPAPLAPPAAPAVQPPAEPPRMEPPAVEVTQPAPEEPTVGSTEVLAEPRDTSRASVKVDTERSRSVSPSPHDRRRRRHEDNTIKYCQALGLNPSVLEGRGIDFDDILTDLGWNGRLGDEKKIEDLEADIRREIGRVEATSWLGNLEQQEGKIDQLAKLIDKTIVECEELDNLLTLYSHELNVSLQAFAGPIPSPRPLRLYANGGNRLSTMTWLISKRNPRVYRCKQPIKNCFRTSYKTYSRLFPFPQTTFVP